METVTPFYVTDLATSATDHGSNMDTIRFVETVLMCICGGVGIVGNGTLILIVLLNVDMRNVPNTLIACLALGDFVLLLWNVPFTVVSYHHPVFPFSEFICKITTAIPILSEGVSVLTLAALSYDRYNAIVRPMHRRRSNAVRQTHVLAILIWVVSTILAIPGFILSYIDTSYGVPLCFYVPHGTGIAIAHEFCRFIIMYVFPLVIISLFYAFVAHQLLASSRDMPGESRGDATKQVKARRRLARSVIVLVVIFAVCWLPYFIYRTIFQFKFHDFAFIGSTGMFLFQTCSNSLIYISSSINPIAMCFLSKTYRRYFANYLTCGFVSKNQAKDQRPGLLSKNGYNGPNSKWTTEGSGQPSVIETKTCQL